MPVKHFLLNPAKVPLSKKSINKIRGAQESTLLKGDQLRFSQNIQLMNEKDNLRCVEGRVVVKTNDKSKDFHKFESGIEIRRERRFNNLNLRETNPVNAIVIDSTYIPPDSEILVHPNSIHDSNRIFNYKDNNSDVRYYSIHEEMCYAWHDGKEWMPLIPFDFGLRVFRPYSGIISGIEPEQLKDTLWVTTGILSKNVVKTIKASDYEIIGQGKDGQEISIIRFRPFGDIRNNREEEAVAILNLETDMVLSGTLLIGNSIKDAKCISH